MKSNKVIFFGLMMAILVFSGAAMAEDPTTPVTVPNNSTALNASTNQLTTKNYVDSGLRAVYGVTQTNAEKIGNLNSVDIVVEDENAPGGERGVANLVEAINIVKDIAEDAAATTYNGTNGVTINNNTRQVSLNGVANNDKMYAYKNGTFEEIPVVNEWDSGVLTNQ